MADEVWDDVTTNVTWCLQDTKNSDDKGRLMMFDALVHADTRYMGEFKDGFYKCQKDDKIRAVFDLAARSDEKRLYNVGRVAAHMKPI